MMIETFPTPERLADAVARHIVARAADAISATGRFTLALSGGSTPRAAYSRLATGHWQLATGDWRLVHILWGDERCVPPDDLRSNYRMAKEALLDRVPIPADQIHRIRQRLRRREGLDHRRVRCSIPDGPATITSVAMPRKSPWATTPARAWSCAASSSGPSIGPVAQSRMKFP